MEIHRDDALIAELRVLRPSPSPTFAEQLDRRAEGGFQPEASAPGRVGARLRGLSLRQVLAPVGATAVVALVAATAVLSLVGTNGDDAGDVHLSGGAGSEPQTQFEQAVPALPGKRAQSEEKSYDAGATYAGPLTPFSASSEVQLTRDRDVERAAQLTLRAPADKVAEDAREVFETVHAVGGIVLNSSINDGSGRPDGHGRAEARFALLVPSAKLSDALASLSQIAEVASRRESTLDITAPTTRSEERVREANARIESLLSELAATETESDRAAVESELRFARRRAEALRASRDNLHQRADYTRVSLRIESAGGGAGADDGRWDVGDAIDDAGRVLSTAAGVSVLALAVLAPLILLAFLLWLGSRAWSRRARERALD